MTSRTRFKVFTLFTLCPARVVVGLLASMCLAACGAPQPPPAAKPPVAETKDAAESVTTSAPTSSVVATGSVTAALTGADGTAGADAGSIATPAKRNDKPAHISARHVLVQWMGCQATSSSVVRTREQALKVAEDVLRRAKGGADFARLAVEFSDEPNAGHRGGSLGSFGHGQMVKQFEDAAFALGPGEISGIVETPFGFHIIQRTE